MDIRVQSKVSKTTQKPYLLIEGFKKGRKVSDLCIFEKHGFSPSGKYSTQGKRNLWEMFLKRVISKNNVVGEGFKRDLHTEGYWEFKVGMFQHTYAVVETDIACIGGINTGADGAFIVKDSIIYGLLGEERSNGDMGWFFEKKENENECA